MASLARKTRDRVIKDNEKVQALSGEKIHYWMNENDLLKGTAMVVGPADTPYFGGFFWFNVDFPTDYPFSPPLMLTLTQDGMGTRLNPNLYVGGKVCLSLLNTWSQGERWSAPQSLASVLLVIQSHILVDNPLQNEPAFSNFKTHKDYPMYNRMVKHGVAITIRQMLTTAPSCAAPHLALMQEHFKRDGPKLIQELRDPELLALEGTVERHSTYNMVCKYKFGALADDLQKIIDSL